MESVRLAALTLVWACAMTLHAQADTLATVRARGALLCGIDRSEAEYSSTDEHGNRAAFDRDLCDAVAVAAIGPGAHVELTYYADDVTSMQALADGKADMIASLSIIDKPVNAEGTALPIAFTKPVLSDATGIMVLRSSGIVTAAQLSGRKICYLTETKTETNLQAWFAAHHLDLLPFPFQEEGEMEAAYVTDNCVGLAGDLTRLAQTRASTGDRAADYVMLRQTFGADPLAMAYRSDDSAWGAVLSVTREVLLTAVTANVTYKNVWDPPSSTTEGTRQRMLTVSSHGLALHLGPDWAAKVVSAVGNYEDLFNRDAGAQALLRLDDTNVRVDEKQIR